MSGYDDDGYREKKDEVLRLFLQGHEPGEICGLTRVPRCRIERELACKMEKDPGLLGRHLRAKLIKRRGGRRWPEARIVISRDEATQSKQEY